MTARPPAPQRFRRRLYVGNLPFDASDDEIHQLFEPFGSVMSVSRIVDRESQRFRGFAFVEMERQAADAAVPKLDGSVYRGRYLRVNRSRPKPRREEDP